ncbi:MAG: DUF2662 domain-containing protein [Chloroflexi bacterium]|nr:MAG: DUF2662 domain-containing protein [Chloroflexota bacterium]
MERLEAFASRMIEGWSARLFRAKLQPVQIAKRLIRAMESHQTVSLSKTFVPNSFVVSLSAVDYAGFEQYRRSLEQDLAEGVLGAARDRNYTLLAFPNVEIERDEDLAPGWCSTARRCCASGLARPRRPSRSAKAKSGASSRSGPSRSPSDAIRRTTSWSTTAAFRASTPRSACGSAATRCTTCRARTAPS